MIRVALIGTGSMVDFHLNALALDQDAQLCAVCAAHMESAKRSADPRGVAAYDDYVKMLETEKPDAVIINLPHFLHESCAITCAEHGAHILLEKPMSTSFDSCKRIIEACEKNHVLLQIAHPQGSFGELRRAREIIQSGEMGELVMIHVRRSANYYVERRPKWFWKKETAGGGIWINLGAHCLDIFCQLTQSPIASIRGKVTYKDGMDVDCSACAYVESESGVPGTVSLSGYAATDADEAMIYLTGGALRLRTWVSLHKCLDGGQWEEVDCSDMEDGFTYQWQQFAKTVRDGKVTMCSGEYAANIIWAIEQLWK